MGKFFSFAGQSLSLLVLYILYSLLAALGVAYVLVTTSFQIRPITLLVLGILAWAAASQGLSFFTDYVLSLELSVYLWTYLCIGFWEAVLVIPVCSCILLIQGLISDSNNRSIGYVLKKVSNIFVLGVSLYSAALAYEAFGGQVPFFKATWAEAAALLIFWAVFWLINNLLFVPMDLARHGLQSFRTLPKDMTMDGLFHALAVSSGGGFALIYVYHGLAPLWFLLPVFALFVWGLRQFSAQGRRLAHQLYLVRKLNETSSMLHQGLSLENVLGVVGEISEEIFRVDTYFIALFDERLGTIQFAHAVENGRPLQIADAEMTQGLTGQVIRTGTPLFISDLRQEAHLEDRIVHSGSRTNGIRSFMMVPLQDKDRTIGVFSIQSREVGFFLPFHFELFLSLSHQVAAAVVGARLYRRATQDSLTRLFNKSYFEEQVLANLKTGNAFGLLFMDSDDFKSINDLHGHLVGDQYLQALSKGIVEECRSTDVPCRYGGDEFAILLPGATLEMTRIVARRILDTVDQIVLSVEGAEVRTTISIGILWFRGKAVNVHVEDVIRKVDRTLYKAKRVKHTIEETFL